MGASGGRWIKALIGLKKPEKDDNVGYILEKVFAFSMHFDCMFTK